MTIVVTLLTMVAPRLRVQTQSARHAHSDSTISVRDVIIHVLIGSTTDVFWKPIIHATSWTSLATLLGTEAIRSNALPDTRVWSETYVRVWDGYSRYNIKLPTAMAAMHDEAMKQTTLPWSMQVHCITFLCGGICFIACMAVFLLFHCIYSWIHFFLARV